MEECITIEESEKGHSELLNSNGHGGCAELVHQRRDSEVHDQLGKGARCTGRERERGAKGELEKEDSKKIDTGEKKLERRGEGTT